MSELGVELRKLAALLTEDVSKETVYGVKLKLLSLADDSDQTELLSNSSQPEQKSEQNNLIGNMNPYYPQIEAISNGEILLEAEMGRGSNSKVFKARWKNTEVAVKRFYGLDINMSCWNDYINNHATKVNKNPHENVIKILAQVTNPHTLITEYINCGSVKKYIRHSRPGSTSIPILDRIEIALQAAKGIKHLHDLGIIHGAITCNNLLMELKQANIHACRYNTDDIRVVVSDYGFQQLFNENELENYKTQLSLKHKAPELIENTFSDCTLKSDIYGFGITMWEIITGQEPYPNVDPVDTAIHVLLNDMRPQLYSYIPEKIQNLLSLCWYKDAKDRPSAKQVIQKLKEFLQLLVYGFLRNIWRLWNEKCSRFVSENEIRIIVSMFGADV